MSTTRTWDDTTRCTIGYACRVTRHVRAKAGLFVYSGCGSGTYYAKNGDVVSCDTTEAKERARIEGVDFLYQDSFSSRPAAGVELAETQPEN